MATIIYRAQCTLVTALVLLQGKNEYSSSAKPYLSLIDDNDTPVPPNSDYLLCVSVYVDFGPLTSEMNNE